MVDNNSFAPFFLSTLSFSTVTTYCLQIGIPCCRQCCGNVTFLSRQESNQRMRHRGGAEAGCSRTRAALPYVPHPARTWQPLEHRNGQNLSDSASTTKADCSTLVRSADFSRCHPSGKKVGTLFVRTGSRLRCSSAIVSARWGFPRGRLSLREQGTQHPLVAFFWYFSWRSKKSTLRTS